MIAIYISYFLLKIRYFGVVLFVIKKFSIWVLFNTVTTSGYQEFEKWLMRLSNLFDIFFEF